MGLRGYSLGLELPAGKTVCSSGGGGPKPEPHRSWFTVIHSFTKRVLEHLVRQEDSLSIPSLLFQFGCDEAVINGARGGKSLDMAHVKISKV